MSNKDLIEYLFKGVIAILLTLCLFILKDFDDSLDKMSESVNALNIKFATMSEKLVNQAYNYNRLEKRLDKLEEKVAK